MFILAGVVRTAISGGIGGASLWTIVFPADVVKSRVQIYGTGSFLATLSTIYRKEGLPNKSPSFFALLSIRQ